MAKVEQQVADTMEVVKLIASTQVESREAQDKLDNTVNKVGRDILETKSAVDDVHAQSKEQTEVIGMIRDSQHSVAETIKETNSTATETLEKVKESQDVVGQVLTALNDASASEGENHEALLKALDIHNGNYDAKTQELIDSFAEARTSVEKLDPHDALSEILTVMNETKDAIAQSDAAEVDRQRELMARLEEVNHNYEEATQQLSALNEKTNSLTSDFEVAISRLDTVGLKLDAVSNTDVIDSSVESESAVENEAEVEGE